jgi:tRNA-dihydrouridine synthase B
MIGRGAYGRPWFINQANYYLKTGKKLADPGLEERLSIILAHYDEMLEHYGSDVGVKFARKHLGWYSSGMVAGAEFRNKMNRESNPDAVKGLVIRFFQEAAIPLAHEELGKKRGFFVTRDN